MGDELAYFTVMLAALGGLGLWIGRRARNKQPRRGTIRTLVVLGSGGHTTEMLGLVSAMDPHKFCPRTYVHADTDTLSGVKASDAEKDAGAVTVETVPRARRVGQSWASTLFTTAVAALASLTILRRCQPDLILCNGPGTCVPFALWALVGRTLGMVAPGAKVLYVESVCRTKSMSLSAKILCRAGANVVLVQWPELSQKNPAAKFVGRFLP